jgi:demethylmenaquinone methyltransferase/2-methoxy-6-polyprenyl-1,4-benzoquinol methylase
MTTPADGSGAMFDTIAERYDLLNKVLSVGLDRLWRRRLVGSLGVAGSERVLDVATGTADVAISIARRHPEASVVGLDPSEGMLAVGQRKIDKARLEDRIELRTGSAEALPFEDGAFAASCIAFGIRNVPDRRTALSELARVTQPGGVVAVLELGEPRVGWLSPLARAHVHKTLPRLGAWLSGSDAYVYLQESIAAFPEPDAFAVLMQEAGLEPPAIDRLSFGAAHLFVSRVPLTPARA